MKTPKHLFNSTAVIHRHQFVNDHGDTAYIDHVGQSFPCRVAMLSAEDSLKASADRTKYVSRMICGPDVDIRNEDHVVVGGVNYIDITVRNPDLLHAFQTVDMIAPDIERAG